jgi:hypothetical protein
VVPVRGPLLRVEVDVAYGSDETLAEAMRETCAGATLWRTLQEHGPGGGWPLVELVGPPGDVYRTTVNLCDGDEDLALELIGEETS